MRRRPATIRSRAVETLAAVIVDAETVAMPAALLAAEVVARRARHAPSPPDGFDTFRTVHGRAMCEAAVTLATTGQAEAIVAVTRFGKTAQLLSSLRPRASILAITPSDVVARRLQLYWGVRPIVSDLDDLRAVERRDPRQAPASRRTPSSSSSTSTPISSRPDANFLNVQRLSS